MKRKKAGITILAFLLLCGCSIKKEPEPTATIKNLYDEDYSEVSDGTISVKDRDMRSLTGAHPELAAYSESNTYGAAYLPVFGKCLNEEKLEIVYRDAVCTVLVDPENPTASYILGSLRCFAPSENDMDCSNDILPYLTIRRAENEERVEVLLSQIDTIREDQISGKLGTGLNLTLICGSGYTPKYAYGVFTTDGTLSNCVLMVTDNVVTDEISKRKPGQPKEPFVVDYKTNLDGTPLSSALLDDVPTVTYSIYSGKTSVAVPSFMKVTEDNGGISVKTKDGDYTPLDYSGMTVVYGDSIPTINGAVEAVKAKAAEAFGYEKSLTGIAVSDIHYEEHIKYLGSDDATHIYGQLLPQKRSSEIAKKLPGNGHILFDVYQVNKGGNDYTVMYYYGETQKDEVQKWIGLNCY